MSLFVPKIRCWGFGMWGVNLEAAYRVLWRV